MKKNTLTIVLFLFFISSTYSQTGDKTITYDKGKYYQYGQIIKRSDIKYILASDSASASEYHKYRVTKKVGGITLAGGSLIALAGMTLGMVYLAETITRSYAHVYTGASAEPKTPNGAGLMGSGAGIMIIGAVILASNPHFKRSINLYNSGLKPVGSKQVQLNLAMTPIGLGIRLKF